MSLGVGQAEQYGHYKSIDYWSATYDKDMVEELANPERLVNGNIDFSFLVRSILPVVLIIFTHNIGGYERFKNRVFNCDSIRLTHQWFLARFAFYTGLLLCTVAVVVFGVLPFTLIWV